MRKFSEENPVLTTVCVHPGVVVSNLMQKRQKSWFSVSIHIVVCAFGNIQLLPP